MRRQLRKVTFIRSAPWSLDGGKINAGMAGEASAEETGRRLARRALGRYQPQSSNRRCQFAGSSCQIQRSDRHVVYVLRGIARRPNDAAFAPVTLIETIVITGALL
jgi:hypothetical protein